MKYGTTIQDGIPGIVMIIWEVLDTTDPYEFESLGFFDDDKLAQKFRVEYNKDHRGCQTMIEEHILNPVYKKAE